MTKGDDEMNDDGWVLLEVFLGLVGIGAILVGLFTLVLIGMMLA